MYLKLGYRAYICLGTFTGDDLCNFQTCTNVQRASFSTKTIPDEWVGGRQHDEVMNFLRHQKDPCIHAWASASQLLKSKSQNK